MMIFSEDTDIARSIPSRIASYSVTPQKLGGPLTNRQPTEILVDSIYLSTHAV